MRLSHVSVLRSITVITASAVVLAGPAYAASAATSVAAAAQPAAPVAAPPTATVADFAGFDNLTPREQGSLEYAARSVPLPVKQSGDPQAVYAALEKSLIAQGTLPPPPPPPLPPPPGPCPECVTTSGAAPAAKAAPTEAEPRIVAALIATARIATCLGASYNALRGIPAGQPADQIVSNTVVALGTCITGGAVGELRSLLIRYAPELNSILLQLGLGQIGAALLALAPAQTQAATPPRSPRDVAAPAAPVVAG